MSVKYQGPKKHSVSPTISSAAVNLKYLFEDILRYLCTLPLCSVQFSCSVVSDICNPMDCSTPGFPVHHRLLELTQIHVHRVDDAIQPSHSLSSPLAFNNKSQLYNQFSYQRLKIPFHPAIKNTCRNKSDVASAEKYTVIIRKVIIIRGRNLALRVFRVIQIKYFRNFSEAAGLNHLLLIFNQKSCLIYIEKLFKDCLIHLYTCLWHLWLYFKEPMSFLKSYTKAGGCACAFLCWD